MTFNLQADLRNEWHWNTKQLFVFLQVEWRNKQGALNQVSVWDSIVTSKDKAFIRLKKHKTKYGLLDIGQGMRSMKYNMTLVYQVMPKIGAMRRRAVPVPMGRFPNEYTS
jgi:signal peptidase complex subunit 3